MIEANESYLIDELIEIGLSKEQIQTFLRKFGGWRLYIRKKKSEFYEIVLTYEQMIEKGTNRSDAIKLLSDLFEKSQSRIRIITKKSIREILEDEIS